MRPKLKAICDKTPPFRKATPGTVNDKGTDKVYGSGGEEDFPGGGDKTEDPYGRTDDGRGSGVMTQVESLSPEGTKAHGRIDGAS